MSDFNNVPSPLDLCDRDLGNFALSSALVLCETGDGGYDYQLGLERSGAAIAKVVHDILDKKAIAFSIGIPDSNRVNHNFCVVAQQHAFDASDTHFGAVVDGERVNTNNAEELSKRLKESDKVTEVAISYGNKSN